MRHFYFIIFFNVMVTFQLGLKATEETRQEYLDLVEKYPKIFLPIGSYVDGEIQIILDKNRMALIEKNMGRDVGIIKRDKYMIWINDACVFPSGKEGIYTRVLWNKGLEGYSGVAVMSILPDGKIVLNCNYRHATRSWEIELPRGGVLSDETIENAAKREALEETGMVIVDLYKLGFMPPDSGLTSTIVPIFVAKVHHKEESHQDDEEAIESIFSMSICDIKKAFVRGYVDYVLRGEKRRIPFRDPFLAYAILIYDSCEKK